MLTVIERAVFLQDIDDFSQIPTEQLGYIASITKEIELGPDITLVEQDEPSEALYFIVEGKVRLLVNGRQITELGEKGVIGTWSLFDDESPNIATAVTVEPTRLLKIDRREFFEIVADYVEITEGILKSLARKVRRIGQQVFEQPEKGGSG
jgi:CRP-like cAMP-binding protein